MGIVPHSFGIVNGRLECTFSRLIAVVPGDENSDFNLDASYYIIIGTGDDPGNKSHTTTTICPVAIIIYW